MEALEALVGPEMMMKKARRIHSAATDQSPPAGVAGSLRRVVAESLLAVVVAMLALPVVVAAGTQSAGVVESLSAVVAAGSQ